MSATFGAPAAVGDRRRAQAKGRAKGLAKGRAKGLAKGPAKGPAKGLVATVRLWWVAHLARRMERVAMVQLQAMNDRELKDIGLTRSQIEQGVKGEFNHWPLIGHY